MPTTYLAQEVFTGHQWLQNVLITVEEGMIKNIRSVEEEPVQEAIRIEGGFIAPAFIDLQIYGANKKLLAVHPTVEALSDLYDYCVQGGATLFQPTLATNTMEVFKKAIDAVRAYWAIGGKGVIGLHLEGPWINESKRGAHVKELVCTPTLPQVTELLEYGKGVISMITLAPEVCSEEVIRLIRQYNIKISAGHSNATYQQATDAFNRGIPAVTHMYNAMSALQHREPGLVGAAFTHKQVRASIIPDGYHADFVAVKIAKEIMKERLFAITDAVTETTEGDYPHQLDGDKYVCNGILSGSALTMHKAFYNLVNKVEIEVEEALRMCSLYPAEVMGLEKERGKIAPGYVAQFVVLNKQLQLVDVING